jgi:hypothetical protein
MHLSSCTWLLAYTNLVALVRSKCTHPFRLRLPPTPIAQVVVEVYEISMTATFQITVSHCSRLLCDRILIVNDVSDRLGVYDFIVNDKACLSKENIECVAHILRCLHPSGQATDCKVTCDRFPLSFVSVHSQWQSFKAPCSN